MGDVLTPEAAKAALVKCQAAMDAATARVNETLAKLADERKELAQARDAWVRASRVDRILSGEPLRRRKKGDGANEGAGEEKV